MTDLFDRHAVIDVDTHLTEPPDAWTARMPAALDAIRAYPDNILFESDYPHPTCQHPGPKSPGQRPREYASDVLGQLPEQVVAKVLHDNAAALYGL